MMFFDSLYFGWVYGLVMGAKDVPLRTHANNGRSGRSDKYHPSVREPFGENCVLAQEAVTVIVLEV
jgi:hypothetical protein